MFLTRQPCTALRPFAAVVVRDPDRISTLNVPLSSVYCSCSALSLRCGWQNHLKANPLLETLLSSCLFRKTFLRRWSSSGIQFWHIDCVCEICTTGQSTHDHRLQMEAPLTPEQEKQLEYLNAEIQILEKQLRISEVRKRIAETELDVVSLQESLQQHLREEIRGR
jgi:hypothetical protein